MALIERNLAGKGGGEFVSRFYSGVLSVPSGASGDVIVLTPPEGQRVKLNSLVSNLSTLNEPGITVTVGDATVVQSLGLLAKNLPSIGYFALNGGARLDKTAVGPTGFLGKTDEVITVTKDTGVTQYAINYTYEFGE